MQSFLIICKNKKVALEFVESECRNHKIGKFDLSIYSFDKAMGIEDVRNLQKKIILKPMLSNVKAIVIDIYNGITVEAQNSLLKVLEEPPPHTIIYILIANKYLLLPTILSRCKIVQLKNQSFELSYEENVQCLNLLTSLLQKSVGERLKLAQDIVKNKDEPLIWLEKMIILERKVLIENLLCNNYNDYNNYNHYKLLISFQKTYTIIKTTNVNQRLALENLFLNL